MEKIIRSLCFFTNHFSSATLEALERMAEIVQKAGFQLQTKRICLEGYTIAEVQALANLKEDYLLSVGQLTREEAWNNLDAFLSGRAVAFNLALEDTVTTEDVKLWWEIAKRAPEKTFHFTYTCNNTPLSPYFPSSTYSRNGFSIGLQPTNLAKDCTDLKSWLDNMLQVWLELKELLKEESDFLGIDSSIAPLFEQDSSFIYFIEQLLGSFECSTTQSIYTQISHYIKTQNPMPIGLCGLMFPCLEDFSLAQAYERGAFSIERNLFLSLHSGLGIDTYPVGMDEDPQRLLEILELLRNLSNKYQKSLAVRFIADGKTKIGAQSDFQNPYLKDVVIRKL
ncbi:MAG: DUF711 family protein [Saprospiraceae bacterium]|nr:DUF711 family protein [Saprospiraceae bacterium]